MSELLYVARCDANEAANCLGQTIEKYRQELEMREGNDTGGEIRKSIDELSSLQNRISRLHEECFLLSQAISDWQKDQDMLSDMADANSH